MKSASIPQDTPAASWSVWLESYARPAQFQLMIWVLLLTALLLAFLPFEYLEAPRQGPSTPLSFLPASWLASTELLWAFRAMLLISSLLWLFQQWLPYSSWLTLMSYTAVWSLKVENTYNTAHILHMANMLIVVAVIWVTLYHQEIRRAIQAGTYFQTPLVPRWVLLTAIAYVGIFHTAAGLSKIIFSGTAWANGVSLQLWAHAFGYEWSPAVQAIIHNRQLTMLLQGATLVVETAGILAIFPRLRTWVGLAILGFYVGVLVSFPYGFFFNAILTAILLLPVDRWIEAFQSRVTPQRGADEQPSLARSLATRFDMLGYYRPASPALPSEPLKRAS